MKGGYLGYGRDRLQGFMVENKNGKGFLSIFFVFEGIHKIGSHGSSAALGGWNIFNEA